MSSKNIAFATQLQVAKATVAPATVSTMNSYGTQEWRKHRLEAFAEREGGKAAAGRRIGYRDGAFVGQMLRGERAISEKTVEAIEALPGYAGWFDRQESPQRAVIAIHPDDDLPEGYVRIPEYKVHFSAGPGRVVVSYELEECSEPATYRLSWLQQERLNPDKLKRFKVKNGSMEPFLYHGDSVLVNEAENTLDQVIDGKVYAIRYGNELRVKRLYYRRISGEVVLRSDNPAYADEEVMASQFNEQISIIGRVRDKSGTGGL